MNGKPCAGFVGGSRDGYPELCDRCGEHFDRHAPTPSGEDGDYVVPETLTADDLDAALRSMPGLCYAEGETVTAKDRNDMRDAWKTILERVGKRLDLSKINAVPDRFFIEHGVVHDRKTGRHLHFDDNILAECDALNAIEMATKRFGGVREEYLCAISKTDAEGPGAAPLPAVEPADADRLVTIVVGGSCHSRTAREWVELARADLKAKPETGLD